MFYISLIALLIILLDQISKIIVVANLSQEIVVIPGFFSFLYVNNTGIAWGLPVDKWILIVITIIALGIFIYFTIKIDFKNNKWLGFCIAFLFGGTIGNFIDRLFRPLGVVDFLSFTLYYPSFTNGFHFETYPFPIFNIADSFLVIGAIMLIIYILFIEDKKKAQSNSNENN